MQLQQTIYIQRAQNALARSVVMTKKRDHSHAGVGPSSLAPCYCPHSVRNRTADIQDTRYPSAELHTRPTPAALLLTTTQVRQSQPTNQSRI